MVAFKQISDSFEQRCEQALLFAERIRKEDPHWSIFFSEVLGPGGMIPLLFRSPAERTRFAKTSVYKFINVMLTELRSVPSRNMSSAKMKHIGINVPEPLHQLLVDEAKASRLTVTAVCLTKLTQIVPPDFLPKQPHRARPKSKPRPQCLEAHIPPQSNYLPFSLRKKSEQALIKAIDSALYKDDNNPVSTDLDLVARGGQKWRAEVEPYDDQFAFVMLEEIAG